MESRRKPPLGFLLLIAILLSAPACAPAGETKGGMSAAAATITEAELRDHIFFLASDDLGGRGLGSEGYRIAALYAASQLEQAGCVPIVTGADGKQSFLQAFSIDRKDAHIYIPKDVVAAADEEGGGRIETFNVVAMIEGSDPVLKNQFVTIGAHLDHVGTIGGRIYNGADDNASGCAAVLEVAEGVALAHPRRSVVFILYAAEESGLHGSRFFVDNCPVPLAEIAANVNLDMVGRFEHPSTKEGIIVVGASAICEEMKEITDEVSAETIALKLDHSGGNNFFRDSDHYSFHGKGIPVVFLFDGLHKEFHTPADDAELIDYHGLAGVARFACELVLELADRDSIPCASERVQ